MSTQTLAPVQPVAVSPAQREAWLSMATAKNELVANLQRMEMQAQGILNNVKESDAYEAIDHATAAYRKLNAEMIEARKPFTNAIDSGIVQPLMAFEKRVKDNPDYTELVNRSLRLRKEEADRVALANQKNQERASFKSFVENEFYRVAAEYRTLIRREFTNHYNQCLTGKVPDPGTDKVKVFLRDIKVPPLQKFNPVLLTGEELMEIYSGVRHPDWEAIHLELIEEMDALFANYNSDLANAAAAIAHQEEQQKLKEIEDKKRLEEERAMNTLIATSEIVTIDEPKIKRTLQVVVVESEAWAKAVMGSFIINIPRLSKYIRVKSWSKLSIGQMAMYLGQLATETGEKMSGLELKEVEK